MKKTRKILIFCIACVFATAIFFSFYKNDVKVSADDSSVNTKVDSYNVSAYEKYISEKTNQHVAKYGNQTLTPTLSDSIKVKGQDYIEVGGIAADGYSNAIKEFPIAEYAAYANSETAKLGGDKVIAHLGGYVTYEVQIPEAGFYTLYLNYYTYSGFSSATERSLKINGELPFADCSAFAFSRVWQDKADVRVKNGVETVYNVLNSEEDENGNFIISKLWRKDNNENELKPQQVEVNSAKTGSPFRDSMGYITEPFEFYFEKGTQTIRLDFIKDYFVIDTLEVRSVEKTQSYAEYYEALVAQHGNPENSAKNVYTRIEAEASATKSSPTLYPVTDRSDSATYPFSITKSYLNTIGGDNWKVLGDWIAWEFSVPESGYYEVSMRAKQNTVRGMFSTRTVSVAEKQSDGSLSEYEVLFDELNTFTVTYNNKWKNVTIGENSLDKKQKCETPYLFYFEEGKTYSLKMEVTLGNYSTLIARLQAAIDELSAIYRKIIAYTTTSPDANRDYELTKKFPELFYGIDPETGEYETTAGGGKFYKALDELTAISTSIKKISAGYAPDADIPEKVYKQGASDKTGVIDSVVVILQKMVDKPREITKRLNSYSTNVSSLGSLLTELREAPLTIDYIEIHTPDVKLDKPNAGFFRSLWDGIASFFASFFIDYSSISETGDTTNSDTTVEVWMTLGRDQANVVRNLIDTSFTGDSGYAVEHYGKNINVDLKLTGGDVLLKATLAGIGPDVALNVDSSLPVNWALRNAVFDLTEFDDFWEVVYSIPDGSSDLPDPSLGFENIYMASSIRQFQFSPLDAADELFDSKKYQAEELREKISGVYALPEKQIFLMMFVRDDVMEELKLTEMFPDGWDNMTWDDMLRLTAELQAQQLQFYLPVNDLGANALNPIFISLLYQFGGELYSTNNMESGLKSEEAMNAFEFWTELYTNYSFPTSASFVNRFRTGEMPIGISYYEMYNTLSVFAPELKGKWSFHLIPGTAKQDADGNPIYDDFGKQVIDHTATASGTGAVLMKQEVSDNVGGEVVINEQGRAAWTFLKWWTNAETQRQFGVEMEGILGSAARHATANVKALQQLAWPQEDLRMLLKQWSTIHEMPQIAGSYITGREMENAFREVINNLYNARETLYEYSLLIDAEINRKRSEFDLPLLKDQKEEE